MKKTVNKSPKSKKRVLIDDDTVTPTKKKKTSNEDGISIGSFGTRKTNSSGAPFKVTEILEKYKNGKPKKIRIKFDYGGVKVLKFVSSKLYPRWINEEDDPKKNTYERYEFGVVETYHDNRF